MDSGSRSSGGAGFDDDDGLAAPREVSSSLKGTPPPNSAKFCCRFVLLDALESSNGGKMSSFGGILVISGPIPILFFFLSRGRTIPSCSHRGSAPCWFSRADG
jgi:hypothetical protein